MWHSVQRFTETRLSRIRFEESGSRSAVLPRMWGSRVKNVCAHITVDKSPSAKCHKIEFLKSSHILLYI